MLSIKSNSQKIKQYIHSYAQLFMMELRAPTLVFVHITTRFLRGNCFHKIIKQRTSLIKYKEKESHGEQIYVYFYVKPDKVIPCSRLLQPNCETATKSQDATCAIFVFVYDSSRRTSVICGKFNSLILAQHFQKICVNIRQINQTIVIRSKKIIV